MPPFKILGRELLDSGNVIVQYRFADGRTGHLIMGLEDSLTADHEAIAEHLAAAIPTYGVERGEPPMDG